MPTIISYRGVRLNQRTIDMIEGAEFVCGLTFRLTQGSYNPGGVQGSAGTHDGGGAVDIALKDAKTGALFPKVRRERIRSATRQVGFASWIRDPSQANWPWHLHAIAMGDPDLSSAARAQVTDYKNGLNGLASKGADDGPRKWVNMTWEKWEAAHPNWRDPFTPAQYANLMQEMKNQDMANRQEIRGQALWMLRYNAQTVDERAHAHRAFDDAIAAGQSLEQALAAAIAVMSPLNAHLAEVAKKNG
ncbi:hypothetical protein GCM10029976_037790 [Kribbella albertanoniae]|uniref:Uncharacterized protein n=1 Tax=Kribbella albertanoniae TaxID=1266829 RepID=A0A4R4Q1W1_9ACTN|nr:hypothetical protein [Kribbella albertanoniae]TDC28938.1 hypothetical protein E1261_17230 [Kribbella albertanoniae]